jgi:hypothetical protein
MFLQVAPPQLKQVRAGPGMSLTTLGVRRGENPGFAGIEAAFADVGPLLGTDQAR